MVFVGMRICGFGQAVAIMMISFNVNAAIA